MKSVKPRKQRKEYFNAPLHKKRKWIAAHLEENLLLKYDRRRVTLTKGDTVRIMRGSWKGHEDKITRVNVKKNQVEIEGVVITKADGKKVPKPIHPSNLLITKLNLTDKWRRRKLEQGLSEELKKEIEAEASLQEKELEAERRRVEELKMEEAEEKEMEMEEEPVEESEKPEEKQEKPVVEEKPRTPKTPSAKTKGETEVKPKASEKQPGKTTSKKEEASSEKTKTTKPKPSEDEEKKKEDDL